MDARPLLITANRQLSEHVRSLAGAGGLGLEVAENVEHARAEWDLREQLLIGDDLCEALIGLPKRRAVSILRWQPLQQEDAPSRAWQAALALGAEQLVELPAADAWLAELLTRPAVAPGAKGRVVIVTGACGGAGASSLAVGLAAAEHRLGRKALLVDGDFAGGGLDLLLGAEAQAGTRWSELTNLTGRLNADSLLPSLPSPSGIPLVSASRGPFLQATSQAWESILNLGQQNFDCLIVDLPRAQALSVDQWWPTQIAAELWCVVPTRIRAIAAAAICIEHWGQTWSSVRVIARQTDRGIATSDLSRALGQPVLGTLPHDSAVAASGELGEVSSGAFARACMQLATELPVS
ncbi:MAG: hypothetical protein Q7L55_02090 [Actinomycetota bacterium]|nr:hypothetical protein [Actinomycetota bacterium]